MSGDDFGEATRLEALWAGEFGDAYVDRNLGAYQRREPFWSSLIGELQVRSALEVGCNVGGNLQWIAPSLPAGSVFGVDVNRKAIEQLRLRLPEAQALWSPARELPFRDRWFDLVFTMGVLIHQPSETLPLVMAEMARCSRRYVLMGEYFAPDEREVPYRDQSGALFRRDYGGLFRRLFPSFDLRSSGFLGIDEGWDDVTWWVFERR